jgi:hypothetical protein
MTDEAPEPIRFDLTGAFFKRQEKLRSDLGLGDIAGHPGTKGDDTELNWHRMLEQFLPRRYGVAQAFVVDSQGHQSEQIDLVIHDRHFSPLLFEVGNACYIPAESVYAAFEVKQDLSKDHLIYAADKLASVRVLHRTTAPVPHAGGTYAPVTPRHIIGGILARRSSWSPPFGSAFQESLSGLEERDATRRLWALDIGCAVEHGAFCATKAPEADLVSTVHSEPSVALIYFVMRLLRLLQAVGSAPAIDYDAYLKSVTETPGEGVLGETIEPSAG